MPRRLKFQHRKKRARDARLSTKASCSSEDVLCDVSSQISSSTPHTSTEVESDMASSETSSLTSPESQVMEQETVLEQATPSNALKCLQSNVSLPSKAWSDQSSDNLQQIRLCKISQFSDSKLPLYLTHTLTVKSDLTWTLYVNGHQVLPGKCSALLSFPSTLDCNSLSELLSKLDMLRICPGHPDIHLVRMVRAKKGKIISPAGKVVCFVHSASVEFNGKPYQETLRPSDCELLSTSMKCSVCKNYRGTLRSMYHRWSKKLQASSDSSSYTNERYLNTPEKKLKMDRLKKKARTALQAVVKLREKVRNLSHNQGEVLDKNMEMDLITIMRDNAEKINSTYAEGTFARLFWEEQFKAASLHNKRQVRWHPVIIKWCLNLKLLSSSAYHALRSSGFVTLPSERTLRDYTNYFKNKPGFQDEVDQQLLDEIRNDVPQSRRYVAVLVDEMKVKEGLVFSKHSGEIIGFTNLGNINDELLRLETGEQPAVAKQILVLMVRGLLFKLEFPYAHFGTRGVTADVLFPIVWEAIQRLEARELKVLCITADGASPNRKFFRMHYVKKDSSTYLYKTRNIYTPENRWLYFISDPPHLIKTVRNCWSHSGIHGTRHMRINGQFIEWRQLWDLFDKIFKMRVESLGLSLLPKLKREHVELSSFSRMRVDLAAQWLEKDFLNYLQDWEDEANACNPDNPSVVDKMMLSRETREGIKITVMSFVEMTRFLLRKGENDKSGLYFLSERISQDPLENYFGNQRARGGRNEHPNVQQCLHNAAALRIQKSMALDPVRGNCSRKRRLFHDEQPPIDATPLPKRKRQGKK